MLATLSDEIDAIAAGRMKVEREDPGFFWGDNGRTLSREEAQVFAIAYHEFPRMITVWEAWFAFLGHVEAEVFGHSDDAIEAARSQYLELTAGNEPHLFTHFATKIGGLSHRQAEAMYWKDWFWTARQGHVSYDDERS